MSPVLDALIGAGSALAAALATVAAFPRIRSQNRLDQAQTALAEANAKETAEAGPFERLNDIVTRYQERTEELERRADAHEAEALTCREELAKVKAQQALSRARQAQMRRELTVLRKAAR